MDFRKFGKEWRPTLIYGLSLGEKILSRMIERDEINLEECRKVYPFGGRRAVLDGYKSVYSSKLESILI